MEKELVRTGMGNNVPLTFFHPVLYYSGGFWVWQLIDVVRLYNKMKSGQTQTTEFKK